MKKQDQSRKATSSKPHSTGRAGTQSAHSQANPLSTHCMPSPFFYTPPCIPLLPDPAPLPYPATSLLSGEGHSFTDLVTRWLSLNCTRRVGWGVVDGRNLTLRSNKYDNLFFCSEAFELSSKYPLGRDVK